MSVQARTGASSVGVRECLSNSWPRGNCASAWQVSTMGSSSGFALAAPAASARDQAMMPTSSMTKVLMLPR